MVLNSKIVCLTFDIEEWFQVENFRSIFPVESWNKQELRVKKNTDALLLLLDKFNIKATFFILGWIAEKAPDLIIEIASKGHEIASHGYSHILNTQLTEKQLREDILLSLSILESIGSKVYGYRAPTFSISDRDMEILSDYGFIYDSSFNSFNINKWYGKLSNARNNKPFKHLSGVIEFPLSIISLNRLSIPISGGGYFRLFPFSVFKRLVSNFLDKNPIYIFYMHPWEIDIYQPMVKRISTFSKFRHYYGIKKTFSKLENFLYWLNNKDFEFMRLIDVANLLKDDNNIFSKQR